MYNIENRKIGFLKNNPVLGVALGLTTALAVTSSLSSGLFMGLLTFVLVLLASLLGALVKKFAPEEILIPVNLVLVAFLAKLGQLLVEAYAPMLSSQVGLFLPLLAVNSLILFATGAMTKDVESIGVVVSKAITSGLSYVLALTVISFFRELLGTGGISLVEPFNGTELFSFNLIPKEYALNLFTSPAGALLVAALVAALFAALSHKNVEQGGV